MVLKVREKFLTNGQIAKDKNGQTDKQIYEVYFIGPSFCGLENKLAEIVKEDLRNREKLESKVS